MPNYRKFDFLPAFIAYINPITASHVSRCFPGSEERVRRPGAGRAHRDAEQARLRRGHDAGGQVGHRAAVRLQQGRLAGRHDRLRHRQADQARGSVKQQIRL